MGKLSDKGLPYARCVHSTASKLSAMYRILIAVLFSISFPFFCLSFLLQTDAVGGPISLDHSNSHQLLLNAILLTRVRETESKWSTENIYTHRPVVVITKWIESLVEMKSTQPRKRTSVCVGPAFENIKNLASI